MREILNHIICVTTCVIITMICSCSKSLPKQTLKAGDLLFQDLNCGEMCDAIEAVTEGVNGRDFSHCAMMVEVDDSLMVIEAIGKGVKLTSLHDFLFRSGDTLEIQNVVFARLKPQYHQLIKDATTFAKAQLGQSYDKEFLLNNEKWYCSELLHESFKAANKNQDFFTVSPMTFKSPDSDDFFPIWVKYYKDLGVPIPEGALGLNPGSISRSNKIEIIKYQH